MAAGQQTHRRPSHGGPRPAPGRLRSWSPSAMQAIVKPVCTEPAFGVGSCSGCSETAEQSAHPSDMGELLTVEAGDGPAILFLLPEFVSGPVFGRDPRSLTKQAGGGGAFLLHWRGFGFGSESQTVRHGPLAQDFLVFPARETSLLSGAAAHHSLMSTRPPVNGFPFPFGKTRPLSSVR